MRYLLWLLVGLSVLSGCRTVEPPAVTINFNLTLEGDFK